MYPTLESLDGLSYKINNTNTIKKRPVPKGIKRKTKGIIQVSSEFISDLPFIVFGIKSEAFSKKDAFSFIILIMTGKCDILFL